MPIKRIFTYVLYYFVYYDFFYETEVTYLKKCLKTGYSWNTFALSPLYNSTQPNGNTPLWITLDPIIRTQLGQKLYKVAFWFFIQDLKNRN